MGKRHPRTASRPAVPAVKPKRKLPGKVVKAPVVSVPSPTPTPTPTPVPVIIFEPVPVAVVVEKPAAVLEERNGTRRPVLLEVGQRRLTRRVGREIRVYERSGEDEGTVIYRHVSSEPVPQ